MSDFQRFDAPVQFVVVGDEGCIVRDDFEPTGATKLGRLQKGTTVTVIGRRILLHSNLVIVRLQVQSEVRQLDMCWISQECKNLQKRQPVVFAKPVEASSLELSSMCLMYCPDGHRLEHLVRPLLSHYCDICGFQLINEMKRCSTCNWDVCASCHRNPTRNEHETIPSEMIRSNRRSGSSSSSLAALENMMASSNMSLGAVAVAGLAVAGLSLFMSNATKPSDSYLQYSNDFELVIRATKDLEKILTTKFDAPARDKLSAKINHVERYNVISRETCQKMRKVVETRNRLVHECGFNELGDSGRAAFGKLVDDVFDGLHASLRA